MAPSVRIAVALTVTALVLVGIKVAISATHQPSDDALIHQALTDSIEASRKGRPGGVMELISKQLKVNQQESPGNGDISRFIRESRPDITLANEKVLVTGDEARIVSPVDLKLSLLGQTQDVPINEVTLVFHKEDAREFLFIPVSKWKLTEVRLPENQIPNLSG